MRDSVKTNFTKRILQLTVAIGTLLLSYYNTWPLVSEFYLAYGNAYFRENRPYVALSHYNNGISYDPLNAKIHKQKGMLYMGLYKVNKEEEWLDKGITSLKVAMNLSGSPIIPHRIGEAYKLKGDEKQADFFIQKAYRSGRTKF